ncbi:alcohol dehydrogenase catalytic domain-containing protein [Nonomuraea sp. NPDC048881]|uniref:alcohol dehydrogenase catalytic domain-containing protein n=1 Tax=Nonomuraea sp. NPDC048881 TaxID=3155030 RepID=UPI0033C5945B
MGGRQAGQVRRPTDALVRVTASCICGSDLWPYGSMKPEEGPARMGHELIGVVEDIGSQVTTLARGDLVVAPFAISDNTCRFCREGLHTSCADPQAGFWDAEPDEGGQAEAVRVPLADGTLVKLPVEADSALMPSLLTLADPHTALIPDAHGDAGPHRPGRTRRRNTTRGRSRCQAGGRKQPREERSSARQATPPVPPRRTVAILQKAHGEEPPGGLSTDHHGTSRRPGAPEPPSARSTRAHDIHDVGRP